MNILVTIDANYIPPLEVMLYSLARHHQGDAISVYLLHEAIEAPLLEQLANKLAIIQIDLYPIQVDAAVFDSFPTTERYPFAMYYRIFAAHFLPPTVDKILYLDPDMVIINSLDELYQMDLGQNFFAASTHVDKGLEKVNQLRLNYSEGIYVNSGILLMNLSALRLEQDLNQVSEYIDKFKNLLLLPDQDVISALYSGRIIEFSAVKYNMTERMWMVQKLLKGADSLAWIHANCHVIHYIGRNKPWKNDYRGELNRYYFEAQGFQAGYIAAGRENE
ncbi:glycosyltransferase family 8 protein [Aerococcaceae bacterium zg-BR9]|uniref:glycosyltransferase family 8 protein n=1 Tax=Aerococcaceae bacterium zg-1292 TaxID=2774330 RepID=UPI0040628F5C|nr:glycosyltransferase family 8 protein [Aerococcaceae bacterium zg-BR9]